MIKVWTGEIAKNFYGFKFLVGDGDSPWDVLNARGGFRDVDDLQAFLKAVGEPPWSPTL